MILTNYHFLITKNTSNRKKILIVEYPQHGLHALFTSAIKRVSCLLIYLHASGLLAFMPIFNKF